MTTGTISDSRFDSPQDDDQFIGAINAVMTYFTTLSSCVLGELRARIWMNQ
jgi:hypothetical protein